jgi:RHS repeat-associated protein
LAGDKRYELSNHLGNVLVVVSDKKIPQFITDNLPSSGLKTFNADVLSYSDYYPFGSLVPNRHASTNSYRYGFQGQEKDDEIKGEGNSLNYTFRMHDPRVGRFFAVDPLAAKYPHNSPYAFSENRVIDAVELEGLEAYFIHGTGNIVGIDLPHMEWNNTETKYALQKLPDMFHNKTLDTAFKWSGKLSDSERQKAGADLANYIMSNRKKGEPITIIGHSHGGNVAIEAANYLIEVHHIPADQINIVALNTPVQDDIKLKYDDVNLYSISAENDRVQRIGSDGLLGDSEVKSADSYIKYEDKLDSSDDYGSNHIGGDDANSKVWAEKLKNAVKRVETEKKQSKEKNEVK